MSVVGAVALAAVAVQLLLTLALQPLQRAAWIGPLDRTALVPMWHFFAFGDPGRELRLFVRDGHDGAPVADWREVAPATERRLRDAVWRPDALAAAHVTTLLDTLVRRAARDPGFGPDQSVAHARLLEWVLAAPRRANGGTARQFEVRGTRPSGASETLFTSRFHDLP